MTHHLASKVIVKVMKDFKSQILHKDGQEYIRKDPFVGKFVSNIYSTNGRGSEVLVQMWTHVGKS